MAGREVGSLLVNLIRLILGLTFLSFFTLFYRGMFFPIDGSSHTWFWLLASGLIGLSLGDLFLFKSFVLIGSRISMLIMSLVPPVTALIGWIIMGETMSVVQISGMVLTLIGITIVLLDRGPKDDVSITRPLSGILCALAGVAGQSIGLVLSKYGMRDFDPFAANQIRLIAGVVGTTIIFTFTRRRVNIKDVVSSRKAKIHIMIGSFFGTFMGISLSLVAVKYVSTGVASTIMAIVPVTIILPSVLLYHQKVKMREIVGAVIAVAGVAFLFL